MPSGSPTAVLPGLTAPTSSEPSRLDQAALLHQAQLEAAASIAAASAGALANGIHSGAAEETKGLEAPPPPKRAKNQSKSDPFDHFDLRHHERFTASHSGAQGVAVLGFAVPSVDEVLAKYSTLHPKLLVPGGHNKYTADGAEFQVLDVYAYYTEEKCVSDADPGTVIRFVQRDVVGGEAAGLMPLPGLEVSVSLNATSEWGQTLASTGQFHGAPCVLSPFPDFSMTHLAIVHSARFYPLDPVARFLISAHHSSPAGGRRLRRDRHPGLP